MEGDVVATISARHLPQGVTTRLRALRARSKRLLALLVAVCCLGVAAVARPAAVAGDTPPAYDPPDDFPGSPCDPAVNPQVPRTCESYVDDFTANVDLSVVSKLKALFGSRYADAWGDTTGPRALLRVGVVNPTPEDHSALEGVDSGNGRLVLEAARYSRAETEEFEGRVGKVLKGRHRLCLCMWGYNSQTHKFEVNVRLMEPEVAAELEAALPPGLLNIIVIPNFRFIRTNATRNDYPPYEGGLGVKVG